MSKANSSVPHGCTLLFSDSVRFAMRATCAHIRARAQVVAIANTSSRTSRGIVRALLSKCAITLLRSIAARKARPAPPVCTLHFVESLVHVYHAAERKASFITPDSERSAISRRTGCHRLTNARSLAICFSHSPFSRNLLRGFTGL